MSQIPSVFADNWIDRWIQACLQSRWSEAAFTSAKTIGTSGQINWEECFTAVDYHGLAPIFYLILRDQEFYPVSFRDNLELAYVRNRTRNLLIFDELKRIYQKFNSNNLHAIILKGAALVFTVYIDIGVRPLGDLDLLFLKNDFAPVLKELNSMGYHSDSLATRPELIPFDNEVLLQKTGPLDIFVEAHWSLFDSPFHQSKLAMDWYWENTRDVHWEGTVFKVLKPEAQVLHLCAHLILHHQGIELLWLHDIAEVINANLPDFDWTLLLEEAKNGHLIIPLQRILPVIEESWGVPIPATVLRTLKEITASREERQVVNRLSQKTRKAGTRFLDDLRFLPDWDSRLIYAKDNLFPAPAYMIQRYKITRPLLLPFYYPYRWYLGLRGLK